ncbi:GNAT family N-acetyltransferase [Ramlibacter sp. AN1015]|uniref:GNAT family N-acetyltransferase n=1 Tax=Ramlibacter sp. AN1015 TaxID=3133428 RepID=UPI0030BDC6C5
MASTEASASAATAGGAWPAGLRLQPLDERQLEGAMALVAQSGWNQVAADWRLFQAHGEAVALVDAAGAVVATAATLPFQGFGWISMVLVDQRRRRQGIATALLQDCIARLRAAQLVPALDATPAGRTVYGPLGFRDGWSITRWRHMGSVQAPQPGAVAVRALREDDWPALCALDRAAFGGERGALLRSLWSRSRGFACAAEREGRLAGFLLGRDGRQATQVGPVVVAPQAGADTDDATARGLLAYAFAHIDGPVLLDVLDAHAGLRPVLEGAGFALERGYTRMALGQAPDFGDATRMVAIAGPELA